MGYGVMPSFIIRILPDSTVKSADSKRIFLACDFRNSLSRLSISLQCGNIGSQQRFLISCSLLLYSSSWKSLIFRPSAWYSCHSGCPLLRCISQKPLQTHCLPTPLFQITHSYNNVQDTLFVKWCLLLSKRHLIVCWYLKKKLSLHQKRNTKQI